MAVRKTSVYLGERESLRLAALAALAREEGRPQAEIIRDAMRVSQNPAPLVSRTNTPV